MHGSTQTVLFLPYGDFEQHVQYKGTHLMMVPYGGVEVQYCIVQHQVEVHEEKIHSKHPNNQVQASLAIQEEGIHEAHYTQCQGCRFRHSLLQMFYNTVRFLYVQDGNSYQAVTIIFTNT